VKLVAPQPQGNERRCKFVSWEWMEEYEYSRPRSYWTTKNEMNNFHVDYRASAKLVSEFPDCANSEKPADKCAADEFCMKRVGADASDVVDSYLGEKRTPPLTPALYEAERARHDGSFDEGWYIDMGGQGSWVEFSGVQSSAGGHAH
ncbi:hypothetical protein THAOC_24152, partial [Thalassiosira oceanica]